MSMSKHATQEGQILKPIVKYKVVSPGLIKVGFRATVTALNHPSPLILDNEVVHTSTVQSYDETTGKFETLDTIYELAND